MADSSTGDSAPGTRARFLTTRWSTVLAARDMTKPGCSQALESLCQTYWFPVYAFVRGAGCAPADAQDLTQEFFVRLWTRDYLRPVAREKGRFRTFLRMALTRFLANERARARAEKRGGGAVHLSIDLDLAEERLAREPAAALAPGQTYDRRWALALLEEATHRLQNEYERTGRAAEWRQLKICLTADRGEIDYASIAASLGVAGGAARVAVHRLRKRFREVFRQTVADTVATTDAVDDELRLVLEILSGS